MPTKSELIDDELRTTSSTNYADIARKFECSRELVRKRADGLGFPKQRQITGPFFRVCEVCGDKKQVTSFFAASFTRCLKHARRSQSKNRQVVVTQPCFFCHATDTLTGLARTSYIQNRSKKDRIYTCSSCKVKNGGFAIMRGNHFWIKPIDLTIKV